jgi:hypothetical protein
MRPVLHAPEAFQGSGIVEHFGRQEFQTHGAKEPWVLGLVDHTHPAAARFSVTR